MMRILSNETLIDSYLRAVDLKLEEDFIDLLLTEIKRRKLKVPSVFGSETRNCNWR